MVACTTPSKPADRPAGDERSTNRQVGFADQTQSQSEADQRITADLRKALSDRKMLSPQAKNIVIVSQDGVVALSGPVSSDAERKEIAIIALGITGVKKVDNQLQVKSN